ncbi:MAG: MarR family transcriptional regulator [Bacteroidales bacterium]|nr:MarR family transcriptional regulator [Bacteroidales bacterium]
MEQSLEQILNTILHSSEMLEDEMKQDSDLKDLTQRQLYCIELIHEMQNPTLTELALKMNIAKPSMTVMIERLDKKGLIRKVIPDTDRRTAHVHLTQKGEQAALLHTQLHRQISAMLTADLTESEQQILMVLLNKSAQSLIKKIQLVSKV